MKAVFLGCVFLLLHGLPAAGQGHRILWEVTTSHGDVETIQEQVDICGDWMRIERSDGTAFLFNREREQAWLIHEEQAHVWQFSFERNRSFYQRFLVPYGIITENGAMLFPDSVFRRTGRKAEKHGVPCEEIQLPGTFLNSRTVAWYPVKSRQGGSSIMRDYLSFFTRDDTFLKQVDQMSGFPVEMEMTVRVNDTAVATLRKLKSMETVDCSKLDFGLPEGARVEEMPRTGVPLMQH